MSSTPAPVPANTPPTTNAPFATPNFDQDENPEGLVGAYTQYGQNGPGLVPTTSTVKRLVPGVYYIVFYNNIPTFVRHDVVTDDLVRLPDSKSDEVIAEIERFWTLKEVFAKYGYSHKRGFLMHGPPGSGKTSTVAVVTKQMVENGGLVVLSNGVHPEALTGMLLRLRQVEPERPLVVIFEDIDTLIQRYGESETLALLDGENSISNVVFIATTNYPENLDGRITNRPSRFDKVVEIGMPNEQARRVYLESRKMPITPDEMDEWVDMTEDLSIAHIKELIVSVCCFGNPLDQEIARLKGMKRTPKSGGPKPKVGFGG